MEKLQGQLREKDTTVSNIARYFEDVVAELTDPKHPARKIATAHKVKMQARFADLAARMKLPRPEHVGAQLALIFDGAFMSAPLGAGEAMADILRETVAAVLKAGGSKPRKP